MIKKQKLIIHAEIIPIVGLGPIKYDKEFLCDSVYEAMNVLNEYQVNLQFRKVFSEFSVNYKLVDYVEENEVCV